MDLHDRRNAVLHPCETAFRTYPMARARKADSVVPGTETGQDESLDSRGGFGERMWTVFASIFRLPIHIDAFNIDHPGSDGICL